MTKNEKGYQPLNDGYKPRREERGNSGGQNVLSSLPTGGTAQSQGNSTQSNNQGETKKD
jgi:hypothetical protein